MLQYWISVFSKGITDSLDFVKQDPNGILFTVLVLFLTVLWLRYKHKWSGWKHALKHLWRTVGEGVSIAIVGWSLVLLVHLYWEPYHLQDDLLRNRKQLQGEYDKQNDKLGSCSYDGQVKGTQVQLLSDQLRSQQTIINGEGGAFTSQQATMNNCITMLAKVNQPEPLNVTLLTMGPLHPDTSKALHSNSYLALTNKIVTPLRANFACDGYIDDLNVIVVGSGAMIGGSSRLSGNAYRIEIQTPAWSSISPLLITFYYNEDDPGTCGITPLIVPK